LRGWGGEGGGGVGGKGGGGAGGEMTQALYAHMNNKTIKKNHLRLGNSLLFGVVLSIVVF
jgi:hypothetical protein